MSVSDSKKSEYSENIMDSENDPEIIDNIRFTCFELAGKYINELRNPEKINDNTGLFVDMLKYIYSVYLKDIIGNNNGYANRYDFILLDKIFNIYTSLVYNYKAINRPNITEFCIFAHINRQSLYNAINGNTKKLNQENIDMVKRWYEECENSLINGTSVFEIFLLKSQYRYNDNLSPIPIESQQAVMAVNELPDLSTCQNAISDKRADNAKQDNANK